MSNYRVDRDRLTVSTEGQSKLGLHDFRAHVRSENLLEEAERFVAKMIEYQTRWQAKIEVNQTVTYGYWTTKFMVGSEGLLEVYELCLDGNAVTWVPGIDKTLSYWQGQRELCDSLGSSFQPPHSSHSCLVSEGVMDRKFPIEGVRYPVPPPDSGWIFTTDLYDGNPTSLYPETLGYVTQNRPELARSVGLSPGYYFTLSSDAAKSGIWFDDEVANYKGT